LIISEFGDKESPGFFHFPDCFCGVFRQSCDVAMQAFDSSARHGDGRLWLIAFCISVLVNLTILATFGIAALKLAARRESVPPAPPPLAESVAMIFPDFVEPESDSSQVAVAPAEKPRFARTSADQTDSPPETRAFIGERDTRATSDRSPDTTAPPLPSQAGIPPKDNGEIETTESDYQDGKLAENQPAAVNTEAVAQTPDVPLPPQPSESRETIAATPAKTPGTAAETTSPPPREALLEGPNPVDVEGPRESPKQPLAREDIRPQTAKPREIESTPPEPGESPKAADSPKPKPTDDKAFKGFQRKTAIVGSITRNGRSALDVADSPLGRYQAVISRAVELEWQRNCVRHRDFITPGFLTVRFFVEPGGKVRSVQFVGDMETGEVQKGFTLNSIRDAGIPAMPRALRKEFEKEPLELIFRFYF
jgi:hypothetical protein